MQFSPTRKAPNQKSKYNLLGKTVKCTDIFFIRFGFIETPHGHSQFDFRHRPEKCVDRIDDTLRLFVALLADAA